MTAENLIKIYLAARDRLLDTITNYQGVGTKVYYNTILLQLEKELKRLNKSSSVFASTAIPEAYQKALDETYDYFKSNGLRMKAPAVFATLHSDAIYETAREMQYQIGLGLEQVGRQVLRYTEAARDNALRTAGLEATGEKLASASTVQDMRNNLISKLEEQGFMTVQYGEGPTARQVPIDVYANMVARSTTREATNTAKINQGVANGYDLVEMTSHSPTCDRCAAAQGRVYSISGNDKRFPALSMAFPGPYRNVHPNCRHSTNIYVEALRTTEELQADINSSNRPFEDDRTDSEKGKYKAMQVKNRQSRNELYQYERYKQRLGAEAPKSVRAFRQIKNAGGATWKRLQDLYKNEFYGKSYEEIPHLKDSLTDYQARKWYNEHDKRIPDLVDKSLPLEDQAKQAHGLRNQYRTQARDLMKDQQTRNKLDIANPNKGFDELLEDKISRKGLARQAALEDILKTAATPNKAVNKKYGIEEE